MTLEPSFVVVGSPDLERSAAFLSAFGFECGPPSAVDAAAAATLYGLTASTRELGARVPGAPGGAIHLVETSEPPRPAGPFAHGPHAIDLYTRDIGRSLRLAADAGAECSEAATYRVGPLTIREAKAVGPGHLVLVFIEVDRRRPSALDREPQRLHSEVHSAVWVVESVDAVLPFWTGEAGLAPLLDATLREPAVAAFMGLPRPDVPLRLAVFADAAAQGPPRFELIEFPEDQGEPVAEGPLAAGLHALGAVVADLDAARAAWPAVAWGGTAARGGAGRAMAGTAPGGVRIEVREGARERA